MYSLFKNNTALGYALTLVVVGALRGRLLMEPERYIVGDQPELYTGLWRDIFGGVSMGTAVASWLTIAITAVCAFMINATSNRFHFTPTPSNLAGVCFATLCGGMTPSLCFHPVLVFTMFYISACNRLFASLRHEEPYWSCYWCMALLSAGSLLWAKGFWFAPFMFVMMFVMRVASGRTLVAGLLGLLTPLILATCYFLFKEEPLAEMQGYAKGLFYTVAFWRTGVYSWIYMGVALLLTALAALSLQGSLLKLGIVESRRARIVIWLIIYPLFLMLLPTFSYETQPLAAVGAALALPRFLMNIPNAKLREATLTGLVLVTAWYVY